jgi:hypothetical protein
MQLHTLKGLDMNSPGCQTRGMRSRKKSAGEMTTLKGGTAISGASFYYNLELLLELPCKNEKYY